MISMKTCAFPGCTLAYRAKGWCSTHYKQALQGTVRAVVTRLSLIERIWARVRKTEACWLWEGATTKKGYGTIRTADGRLTYVHVLVFTHMHGPLLPGLEVAHSCDVRNCVRPDHLSAKSHAGNMNDMAVRGRAPNTPAMLKAVREIRQLKAAGIDSAVLAERFGIARASIDGIAARSLYGWVPDPDQEVA
jgi:HNH endonuclease